MFPSSAGDHLLRSHSSRSPRSLLGYDDFYLGDIRARSGKSRGIITRYLDPDLSLDSGQNGGVEYITGHRSTPVTTAVTPPKRNRRVTSPVHAAASALGRIRRALRARPPGQRGSCAPNATSTTLPPPHRTPPTAIAAAVQRSPPLSLASPREPEPRHQAQQTCQEARSPDRHPARASPSRTGASHARPAGPSKTVSPRTAVARFSLDATTNGVECADTLFPAHARGQRARHEHRVCSRTAHSRTQRRPPSLKTREAGTDDAAFLGAWNRPATSRPSPSPYFTRKLVTSALS
ncbi:hypothetical protein BKA93DRAFT_866404 [Sparassis latifolia]